MLGRLWYAFEVLVLRRPHLCCRDVADFLMAYLDGELPASQTRAFEKHLAVCPNCVAYLETYKKAAALAKDVCDEDAAIPAPPESLVRAILAARKSAGPGPHDHHHN